MSYWDEHVSKPVSTGVAKVGAKIDSANPAVSGPRKAKEAAAKSDAAAGDLYTQTGPLNQALDTADTAYGDAAKKSGDRYISGARTLTNDYNAKIGRLDQAASDQANDASFTYKNSILPEYKNAMSTAKTNAGQAMSLAQAGDPNNPVMKAVRDLYNQEGASQQGIYNDQGQVAHKQGQADYGVLSALGAQASRGQFGAGGPLTNSQMGSIYNANQSQASGAYAKAQQRMYDLQQQGINANVGLRSQGLGQGFDQSNQIYGFGQQAQDRYSNTIKDLQGGENSYNGLLQGLRGERSGYAGNVRDSTSGLNSDIYNIGMSNNDITKGNAYAGTGRKQQALNQRFGVQQQNINNVAGSDAAAAGAKGQLAAAAISGGAQVAGAAAGAPTSKPSGGSGAAAGSAGLTETDPNYGMLRKRDDVYGRTA